MKKWMLGICSGLLAVVVLAALFSSMTVVKTGEVVVITRFGNIVGAPLDSGMHFKTPFVDVANHISIQVKKIENEGNGASKDLQDVKLNAAVNYSVEKEKASSLFQSVGMKYEDTVLNPAIMESVKAVVSNFTAEQLITKRQEVSQQVTQWLSDKMIKYGIHIVDFNILNLEFSEEFNKAIEAKQIAEQNVLKEKQELERTKIEAQKLIEEANGEAQALKIKREEVTEQLLELRRLENENEAIKKWDGKLPAYMAGSTVPFVNIGEADAAKSQ